MPILILQEYSRHHLVQITNPESPFYFWLCRNIKDDVWNINQAVGKNTLSKFVKKCAKRPEKKDGKLTTAQEKLQSLLFWSL